jgi:uncharacterized membrane protein YdjX (TVP38/TMEM64 family)
MAPDRDPTEPPDGRRRFSAAKVLPLVALAAAAVLVVSMGWHRALSLETLVTRRAELEALIAGHYLPALLAYVGLYIAAVALSVPGAVFLTIGGGVLFGWLVGGIAAALGATIGATLVFLIARHALHDLVERRLGPRLAAITEGFRADAFSYLLFLRLVPLFPFFLVNIAPALAGVSVAAFVGATAIGILPGGFAFAFFGAGLDSAIAGQKTAYDACVAAGQTGCRLRFDIGAALTPQFIAALCALGATALIPVAVKRWRARKSPAA